VSEPKRRDRRSAGRIGLSLATAIVSAAALVAASSRVAFAQGGRGDAVLAVHGSSSVGQNLRVIVAGGLSGGDVTLIVDPDPGPGTFDGAPLCLANGPNATTLTGALNALHFKVFDFAIPADPGLVGRNLRFQAAIADSTAPEGIAVTNCVTMPVRSSGNDAGCENGIGSLSGFLVSRGVPSFPATATVRVLDGSTGAVLAALSATHDPARGTDLPGTGPCDPIAIERVSTVTRCNELVLPRIAVQFRIDAVRFPRGVLPDTTTLELDVDGIVTRKTVDASCAVPLGVGQKLSPLYLSELVDGPLVSSASIDGVVFCDDDEDGVRGANEAPIPDVVVTLRAEPSDGGPFERTAATDSDGRYAFTVPVTGGETVAVNVEVSLNAVPGKEATTPVAGGRTILGVCDARRGDDFGFGPFCEPAIVSGIVYCDENRNGAPDDGETGIEGVTLTLRGVPRGGAPFEESAVSDRTGAYAFEVTVPRDGSVAVSVCVDASAVPGKTVPSGRECSPETAVSECGQAVRHAFGFEPVCADATFTGLVFCDDDGDGFFGAGESGLPGILVLLHARPSDGPESSTTVLTDGDGRYAFSIALPRGGWVEAFTSVESDSVPGKSIPEELACSDARILDDCGGEATHDFGFEPVCDEASFLGVVWCDDDGNGVRGDGEAGIEGIPVTLHADPSDGPPYEETDVTDADGRYGFALTIPRNGSITAWTSVPVGAVPRKGVPLDRSLSDAVEISTCGGRTVHDFGFAPDCTGGAFTGLVFCDDNANGLKDDGEAGIGGVEVTLHLDPHPGLSGTMTASTDGEGRFSFEFEIPDGGSIDVYASVATDGVPGKTIPAEISCSPTSLLRDCEEASHEFGYRPECGDGGTYSGIVFCDANGNGARDLGEGGLANVEVTLHADPHPGAEYERTASTDADGRYEFALVIPSGGSVTVVASVEREGVPGKWIPEEFSCSAASELSECGAAARADFGFRTDGPEIRPGDFKTFTHGAWGSRCSGRNTGCLRDAHFAQVFPAGLVLGDPDGDDADGVWALVLTSSRAVQALLPNGGTPGALRGDLVDPEETPARNLASQLVAATLNVAFNDAGHLAGENTSVGLGDLVYVAHVDSELIGLTVRRVLEIANHAVAGETHLVPAGVSFSDLSSALAKLNENFDEGTVNEGTLGLP